MTLLLRNVDKVQRSLFVYKYPRGRGCVGHDFKVEIRRADGKVVPLQGGCLKKHIGQSLKVQGGHTIKLPLDLLDQRCLGVRKLAPGKYTVTVRHGTLATGAVQIEVVKPAARKKP